MGIKTERCHATKSESGNGDTVNKEAETSVKLESKMSELFQVKVSVH